jgi:PelA/Pel-15E family pectate lyase
MSRNWSALKIVSSSMHRSFRRDCLDLFGLLLALGFASTSAAGVIGTNTPSRPLTTERIAALPVNAQAPWKEYLERSVRQRKADQDFLRQELREHQVREVIGPKESRGSRSMPLENPNSWYSSAGARSIADNIVSYQTPAGGWSKNFDLSVRSRLPGEPFGPGNRSSFASSKDFDIPIEENWNYIGTFDNDATITQLRFLAKVIANSKGQDSVAHRSAFQRGLDYIFAAQYPNGGWPQVWPLQGGYHDSITLNDNAMINIMSLLDDVAKGTGDFAFISEASRRKAAENLKRGLDCILTMQVVVKGRRTIWCQQYDALTLRPDSARNYEMPSRASAESAGLMMFLLQIPRPSPEIMASLHSAAAWFEKTKLEGVAFKGNGTSGRHLVPEPGGGPLWSRYYDLTRDEAIFGDRDKTIHDNVEEISTERRNGYSWYTDAPKRALQHYAKWKKAHPLNHAE